MSYGLLSENTMRRTEIRRAALHFLYYKDTLYRRSFEEVLLRYLGENEAVQALQEVHSTICELHQSGPKLHYHIKLMGCYWPTMEKVAWSMLEDAKLASSMQILCITLLKCYI